jgi:hypothetical protein
MASYVKYNTFAGDLAGKVHDLLGTAGSTADTLKWALTNTAPNVSTHTVLADITEISGAGGHGYTSGGAAVTNVGSASSGTFTLVGSNFTWTSDGSFPTFRYVVMYNSTASGGPLISYWDFGSSLTMTGNGDTFTVQVGANIFTLA